MKKTRLVSFIVPVFNERPYIDKVMRRFEKPLNFDFEVILVDDGSRDGSAQIIEKYRSRPNIKIITFAENRGKGACIRAALDVAQGEIYFFQDSDLEYEISDCADFVSPILNGTADAVYADRFAFRDNQFLDRFHREANKVLSAVSGAVCGARIADVFSGFKTIRADLIDGRQLTSDRFSIDLELVILAAKAGARFKAAPVKYRARTRGQGKKLSWQDSMTIVRDLIKFSFKRP